MFVLLADIAGVFEGVAGPTGVIRSRAGGKGLSGEVCGHCTTGSGCGKCRFV